MVLWDILKPLISSFLEKIPFDIFTAMIGLAITILGILSLELFDNLFNFLNYSLNHDPVFVFVFGISLLLFVRRKQKGD